MSARPAVEVHGLRTMRRTLKAAGQNLDTGFKDAHARVANIVVVAARPRTPVGPSAGGHLRDDIRGTGQAAAAVIRAGRAARPYAGRRHFGDPHVKTYTANPWITDAMRATQPAWLNSYTHDLQKILDHIEGTPGP